MELIKRTISTLQNVIFFLYSPTPMITPASPALNVQPQKNGPVGLIRNFKMSIPAPKIAPAAGPNKQSTKTLHSDAKPIFKGFNHDINNIQFRRYFNFLC